MEFSVVLICISILVKDAEHLQAPTDHLYLFCGKMPIHFNCPFLIGYLFGGGSNLLSTLSLLNIMDNFNRLGDKQL